MTPLVSMPFRRFQFATNKNNILKACTPVHLRAKRNQGPLETCQSQNQLETCVLLSAFGRNWLLDSKRKQIFGLPLGRDLTLTY